MSARETILGKVRKALHTVQPEETRRKAVADRLKRATPGIIPARGQLPEPERTTLFAAMAEKLSSTVEHVAHASDVPKAVANYLRDRNLPASIRMGADKRLVGMRWDRQRTLQVKSGASDGDDLAGVSHALAGIAETGTLVMVSGQANPTTINFLPEHHIVVVDAVDIVGDLETALARVRKAYGKGKMPRALNFISGPSRSGDVEQKIVLGAHGPKALHLIVVGG